MTSKLKKISITRSFNDKFLITGALTEYNTSNYLPNKVSQVKDSETELPFLDGVPFFRRISNFTVLIEKNIPHTQ